MGQQVYLFGNCGKDPEVKTVGDNNTKLATFTLATNKKIKDEKVTEWHNVKAWRWAADKVEQKLRKGDVVAICGELHTDEWTDDNGEKKFRTWIEVAFFENIVIEPKGNGSEGY
jgi:single-strand DNA-binding protein